LGIVPGKNEEEMGTSDRAFHLKIMDLSRNKVLLRLAEGYRVLSMAVRASRDPGVVHEEHLQIVEAIGNNLPDAAEKLMLHHLAEARRMIELQAARNEFTPEWVKDSKG
jgi:DNA-binding GntR family transcriptional regulator